MADRQPIDAIPSQDLDAEMRLLSAAMHGAEGVEALYTVEASDFYRYRPVFEAALEVVRRGKVVNKHSIAHVMRQAGLLDNAWRMALETIDQANPGTTNAAFWAESIVAASVRRRVDESLPMARVLLQDEELTLAEFTEKLHSLIYQATDRAATRKQQFEPYEIVPDVLAEIESRYDGKRPAAGLSTGLANLDFYRRLQPGNLIVVAGRTSMGKTCAALTMALSIALDGHRVIYFSTEMEKEEIHERLIAMLSNTSLDDIMKGLVLDHKREDVRNAARRIEQLPFTINTMATMTPSYVMAQIRRIAVSGPVAAVFADHLHRMQADVKCSNDVEKYGSIAQGLKTAARTFHLPVIAMAQMNRAADGRPDKEPIISDLRGSGTIEEEADMLVFVYRPAYYAKKKAVNQGHEPEEEKPEEAELIVHKNRRGRTGKAPVIFHPAQVRFYDPASERDYGSREEETPPAAPTGTARSVFSTASTQPAMPYAVPPHEDPFSEEFDHGARSGPPTAQGLVDNFMG